MFDFGEDLTIESYRVPWLIWIQLLVMVLLIILLYSFSIFAFDLHDNSQTASSSSSSTSQITSATELQAEQSLPNTTITTTVTTSFHSTKVGEDVQVSSIKDAAAHFALVRDSHHPCHYLGLARQAFLKCLGLDSLFESSSERRKRKDR